MNPVGERASCRLKFHAGGDEGPQALLYASDASRFDGPLARFAVDPSQEVPRVPSGSLVEVEGNLELREVHAVHCADGVVVQPTGRIVGPQSTPLFAEPGLVHPAIGGSARSDIPTTRQEWDRRLEASARRARCGVAGAIFLALCSVGLLAAGAVSVRLIVISALSFGGSVTLLVASHHARRLLVRAEAARSSRGRQMRMRLWWAVGNGIDIHPVASLSSGEDQAEVDVVLAAVPAGFDPAAPVDVEVHGDPRPGGTALIRCGHVELWPASIVLEVLGS
jgi:hypothetical protein